METFSLWGLMWHAPFGVQFIMIVLVFCSIYSWAIIFKKISQYAQTQSVLKKFENRFWNGDDWKMIASDIQKTKSNKGINKIFKTGFNTFFQFQNSSKKEVDDVVEIVTGCMNVEIVKEEKILEKDLAVLATISSTAPYIGLLGTVYGILIAFWNIGLEKQATIATVAPSIAEALIATAMGLFVAIPALVAFNKLTIQSNDIVERYRIIEKEMVNTVNKVIVSNNRN